MSNKLQLTTLAVLVSAALPAQAALYKVVEVTPSVSGSEYYGTAIEPSPITDNGANSLGCFETTASSVTCEGYKLAGETRDRAEGVSYTEEVPFAMDNSFGYIEDDYDGFVNYCFYQLGYSTCKYWANNQWTGWSNEIYGSNDKNSLAFVTDGGTIAASGINTVINSLDSAGAAVGNFSSTTNRNAPISGDSITGFQQGRQWSTDGTYTVGSVTSKTGIGADRYDYYSKPAVWTKSTSTLTAVNWAHDDEEDGDYYAQGSMRDLYVNGTEFYGVGYNNYDDQHMNATIFQASINVTTGALGIVGSTLISGAQVEISGDNVNSNSVATNINDNLVVVGQAKRSGSYPQNGAAGNRLFVTSATSPTAHFLDSSDGEIFFNGVGGEMGSINNFNEIVGRIDVDTFREYDGKQRRQRAFIYPYKPTESARADIFQNKAWIIDNLTNGGTYSGNNNQYRIYDATDINDAGVISATATKCYDENGSTVQEYDSTVHDAYCGDGNGTEKIVAVKLVPISDPANRNIETRGYENNTTERQGGSLGFGALTLLGLFGFMRKRSK
ncbi:DUF3466 family protein [Aliivibrio salmonicida]|uniref:Exported protein n=1 Tax=Aliivibrio salmonicida (strain LFI1238) TaxID=316275 RepID=B6ELS1_ALISL|nr:DUF3466 family protein [Aliivibrio salmonicida]AZL84834.1 DUF3466 family protein [Aliivibrio salmonicida]CAQ79239.1 putative exported protein [Aliivibrio salmonicida LFI1238]